MKPFVISLSLILSCAWTLTHVAAEETPADKERYAIRMDFPKQVGARREVQIRSRETMATQMLEGDRLIKGQETLRRIELEAIIEVTEVNDKGKETATRIEISKFEQRIDGDEPTVLAAPGSVVLAKATEKGTSVAEEDEEAPLSDEAMKTIAELLALQPDMPSDQETFGTDTPRSLGESWPANREKLEEGLRLAAKLTDSKTLEGKTTLVKKREVDGVDMLEFRVEVNVVDAKPTEVPPGAIPGPSKFKIVQDVRIPADYSTDYVARRADLQFTATMESEEGTPLAGLTMKADIKRRLLERVKYLDN